MRPLLTVKTMRPMDVVPRVALVLLHDGELHAVNQQQLFQRQAQGLGHQDVDLHQRHAAGVVGAQGTVALPGGREAGEEVLRQARVVGVASALLGEVRREDLGPQGGVVGGQAVEGNKTHRDRHTRINSRKLQPRAMQIIAPNRLQIEVSN
jgi:hypothetical protein